MAPPNQMQSWWFCARSCFHSVFRPFKRLFCSKHIIASYNTFFLMILHTIFFFQTAILLSTYHTFAYQLWERQIFRRYFQGTPLPLVNELPQKLFFTQICGPDISLKDPHLCLWLQPIGPFVAVSYLPLLQTWQSLYLASAALNSITLQKLWNLVSPFFIL